MGRSMETMNRSFRDTECYRYAEKSGYYSMRISVHRRDEYCTPSITRIYNTGEINTYLFTRIEERGESEKGLSVSEFLYRSGSISALFFRLPRTPRITQVNLSSMTQRYLHDYHTRCRHHSDHGVEDEVARKKRSMSMDTERVIAPPSSHLSRISLRVVRSSTP